MKVNEIFGPTIQGEGRLIGTPTFFVRMQGCDNKCKWCDTKYARGVGGSDMTVSKVLATLEQLRDGTAVRWVTITGGNPALQDLSELIRALHAASYLVALETQGTVWKDWIAQCDVVCVSPKPPSSGCSHKIHPHFLEVWPRGGLRQYVFLKIVVFDADDLMYVVDTLNSTRLDVYLQVGTSPQDDPLKLLERYRMLLRNVLIDRQLSRVKAILPQMHVLLWGNKRGV